MPNLLQNDQLFYITIADVDIKSLKSLHILFVKYWDHILVKFKHMVQTMAYLTIEGPFIPIFTQKLKFEV